MTKRFEIPDGKDALLRIGSREVKLTNLGKVFWEDLGLTKRDLLQYYADVSPWLLPHIVDRAMVMKRYPNGAAGEFFYMPGPAVEAPGIFIITPGYGLVPPHWRIDAERIRKLRKTPIDIRSRRYKKPLIESAQALAAQLSPAALVVLLGSVATGKYVDLLWPRFGNRLRFPRRFAGIGDMSRGAMMLRAARSGEELEYVTLDVDRHRPKGTRERDLSGLNLNTE